MLHMAGAASVDEGTGEAALSDSKIRHLIERAKGLESSNARLRQRAERILADQTSLSLQNEELSRQIGILQAALDRQQAKNVKRDPLRVRLAGPVEQFANRTGEKWPPRKAERRRPFPVGQETGAAVDALKQILAQIFESVSDACDFFNTSLLDSIGREALRRGIQRLRIKNLDPEHVLCDLDRRTEDGLTCSMFLQALDWQVSPRAHTGVVPSESRESLLSVRESKPRVEAAVSAALESNPQGWDAMTYMSKFKAAHQEKRARPQYDPATLIDFIEPQDVRLLTAREKFMIKSMKPPESGKFRPPKKGTPLAERLSYVGASGWKSEPEEEDPDVRALRLEHERSMEQRRGRADTATSKSFKLDLSGLTSPLLPESITFRSNASTRAKVIKPQHKLTDGFAFSEDSDNIRHLMREHEAIMSGRRPIVSAVTSDHTWLKQNALLAAMERQEQEKLREKERYDLDGRCWPNATTASANASIDAEGDDLDASLEAAVKSGDRAELAAILKRRQNESINKSSARDPYQNASAANIAYMKVQDLVNSSMGILTQPKDDPALKVRKSPDFLQTLVSGTCVVQNISLIVYDYVENRTETVWVCAPLARIALVCPLVILLLAEAETVKSRLRVVSARRLCSGKAPGIEAAHNGARTCTCVARTTVGKRRVRW